MLMWKSFSSRYGLPVGVLIENRCLWRAGIWSSGVLPALRKKCGNFVVFRQLESKFSVVFLHCETVMTPPQADLLTSFDSVWSVKTNFRISFCSTSSSGTFSTCRANFRNSIFSTSKILLSIFSLFLTYLVASAYCHQHLVSRTKLASGFSVVSF